MGVIPLSVLGFILIGSAILILIIYCILLIRSLIPSAKKLEEILDEVHAITEMASKNTRSVHELVTSLSGSADDLSKVIKGNQSTIAAATTFINAVASFKNIVFKKESKE